MTWLMRVTALLVVLGLAMPLLAQNAAKPDTEKKDDKKADDPKPDDKKKDDDKDKKDKLLPAGTLQGKIKNLDVEKKTMKLEVTYYYQKPNNDEYRAMLNAQNSYIQAVQKRDARGAAQAQQDIATHSAKLYSTEKKTMDVDLQIMDDAKIRVANPPVAFDDDGKVKKYTKKELDALKGDPKLPGYPAEFDALGSGSMVQVTLVKKKTDKPEKPMNPMPMNPMNPGGVGGPKPKDVVGEDALADHLPLASLVLIVQQGENK